MIVAFLLECLNIFCSPLKIFFLNVFCRAISVKWQKTKFETHHLEDDIAQKQLVAYF